MAEALECGFERALVIHKLLLFQGAMAIMLELSFCMYAASSQSNEHFLGVGGWVGLEERFVATWLSEMLEKGWDSDDMPI